MRPSYLDNMSEAMADVYGAVTDRILINLASYFPYIKDSREARDLFQYQARMLAQMGQINKDTTDIIVRSLGNADAALRAALEAAILDALKTEEPQLQAAAKKGLTSGPMPPVLAPNQMQAFKSFYDQSADKLNLVNTVMLESTQAAYQATVADAAARIQRSQSIINAGTGEVVTGVSSWNQAMHDAVRKMVDNGLTGFIDHAGRRWTPEAYVAMDIRTTMFNTARAAVWERNEDYGNDLYQVSSHNGARPLCYPWQGKVISRTNISRTVQDLNGNDIEVIPQNQTSYGQAAGLFGVNCKHYPMTFIPGFSTLRGTPQDPDDNAKSYAESQQQRALERALRDERRELAILKAQGADPDAIKEQYGRVRAASDRIDDFCEATGRGRRRNREGTPINAKWPEKTSYDPSQFPTDQRDRMNTYFGAGTAQRLQNVARQATPTPAPVVQSSQVESSFVKDYLPRTGITRNPMGRASAPMTVPEIIDRTAGSDQTKGSCASLAYTYTAERAGFSALDFRGGRSQEVFAYESHIVDAAHFNGVNGVIAETKDAFKSAREVLGQVAEGKEYILSVGRHAAIVRKGADGMEYLELQSSKFRGFHPLDDDALKYRFGAQHSRSRGGIKFNQRAILIDVDALGQSPDFVEMMAYINTAELDQQKGAGGGIK